jgi:formate hydrogenlyase subunit 3/multisubunit Na+/H+ antiporter MnhD subunit
MTLGAALGAAFADNLILLFVFWGMLAACLYLLAGLTRTDGAAASAKKSMIIIGGTDALMLFGIALMWKMTGTFSLKATHIEMNSMLSYIAYFCIAAAAFAKAGAVPLHSWIPDVAENVPAGVTAYLPASLDKLLGIYLLARASLSLFVMNGILNTFLLFMGSLTVIFAVAMALVQHDLKRLLGYHAVSQVGYMVIGIGTANPIGIAGGLFHMLNHAVYKSCLFLGAGAVENRARTTDLSRLGGISKYMPVTFICFLTASLSISGIPPLNGFFSKWMIYQGIIELGSSKNPLWVVWLVSAMFGSALTVASFMKLLHAVFLGRPSAAALPEGIKEARLTMLVPVAALAIICVLFGLAAYAVPLSMLILPAIGRDSIRYIGMWDPTAAAALILAGIAAGVILYMLIFPRKARVTRIFIGGEDPQEQALGPVTGAEFCDTMKALKLLGPVYAKEAAGSLDIYEGGKKTVALFTHMLQRLHNGVLPTYLVWCLLGMMGMFIFLFLR